MFGFQTGNYRTSTAVIYFRSISQRKNHIAKALVPLLQIWLYATRDEGIFEKRYDELCQFLNIRQYRYRSLITRTLGPSLDELKQSGYLAEWQVEKTSDRENYKIVFHHGEKFHRDHRTRLSRKRPPGIEERNFGPGRSDGIRQQHDFNREALAPRPTFDPQLVAEFTRRGITETKALELLANLKPGQDVVAQLEHTDYMVQHARYPINNPPGFYIRLISSNTSVPESFETNAKRKAREENERKERERRAAEDARQFLESEYDDYCSRETDRYIESNPAAFEAVKDAKREETRARYSKFPPDMIESMAAHEARSALQKEAALPTFEEFLERKRQTSDFSMKPVAVLADAPVAFVAPAHQEIVMTDDAVIPTDRWDAERGEDLQPLPEPPTEPAMPEAGIEPLPEPPQPAPNGTAVDSGAV